MKVNYNHSLLSSAQQKFSEACAHAGSVILRMTALGEAVRGKNVALALTVFSGMAYAQTTYTFNYTGSTQTINLAAGNYSIQCWGADGGNATNGSNPMFGGKGGFSTGVYTNTATATFNIYVGGHGGNASGTAVGGGGGGMSDIAPASNTTIVIIAAGGGGGGTSSGTTSELSTGGDGGGLIGGTAIDGNGVTGGTAATGGSQTAGGFATAGSYGAGTPGGYGYGGGAANGGTAGVMHSAGGGGGNGGTGGWNGGGGGCTLTGINDNAAGGGAGYYGGGGGRGDGGAGGGGSSYIGGVTSATTIMFGQPGFVTNPDVTGNGRVLITELCSIMIISSSTGTVSPATLCSGNSLTLTTTAVSGYSWSTGATTSSIIVAPTTNTVYSLTGTSSLACTAGASMSVTVTSGLPVLSVTTSTNNTCPGKTVTLTATGAVSYTWTNGVVNGASYSPSVTNTYTVIGQNGCGTVTAQTSITVAPLQVNAISSPTIVCAGSPSTLSAVAAATSFTWYPNSPNTASTVVNPTVSTIYTVTATDGTCSGVTTVSVAANPVPTISIVPSSTVVCAGNPATLIASGGINYTWTPALPSVSTVTVYPSGPTLYSVIGDNSFSCTSDANQILMTNPSPTVNITPSNTFICLGAGITLMASGSATSYAWVNGPSSPNFPINPTSTIIYTVVGTGGANNNNCTTTKTATVNVFSPILTIGVSPSSTICSGTSVKLTASGTDDFNWVNGPPLAENNVTPNSTTIYTVSGNTATLNLFCSTTKTIQIKVNPNPTVTATSTRTDICKGEAAILNAGGAPSFSWSSGQITTVVSVTPSTFGMFTYSVTGTDTNNCKGMATIQVKVGNCTGIATSEPANEQQILVFPNPSKEEFFVQSDRAAALELLNELGQKITTIKLEANNGYKTKVTGLSSGIYFLSGNKNEAKVYQKIIVN